MFQENHNHHCRPYPRPPYASSVSQHPRFVMGRVPDQHIHSIKDIIVVIIAYVISPLFSSSLFLESAEAGKGIIDDTLTQAVEPSLAQQDY